MTYLQTFVNIHSNFKFLCNKYLALLCGWNIFKLESTMFPLCTRLLCINHTYTVYVISFEMFKMNAYTRTYIKHASKRTRS